MQMLKSIFFAITGIFLFGFSAVTAKAQIADPTTWTYEVKKKTANEYELIFHLKLADKWHIWSMKPGGDGSMIPPTFNFDKNVNVQLIGGVTEHGKPVTTTMDGVDGKLTYLPDEVNYVQVVKVKGTVKITGVQGYQVCNDMMCLPPKNKKFEFVIN